MGGSNGRQLLTPEMDSFSSRFTYIRNKGDVNFYVQNLTTRQYAAKTIVCDTKADEAQFFAFINKLSELQQQNIISIQKIYCLENSSCGTTASKYMILFPYPFRSIKDQREERSVLRDGFTEPEIWSIILSVCRALLFLQEKGIPYSPLTAHQILIDKQGLIQIDANHLIDNSIIQDNYVSRTKNLRYLPIEFKQSRTNYMNIRQIEKSNMYSIGIIAIECIEVRDLVELEESHHGRQRQVIQLLINRSTHVSSELRQIIRRLTDSTEHRPTYQQIIDFIENQQTASTILYHQQNQIPTAKKQSLTIDQNSLNFDGFGGRPSSNVRLNMQRSSTLPNGNYSIPSFSYNNINQGIKGSELRQTSAEPNQPQVIQRVLKTNPPEPVQLFPPNVYEPVISSFSNPKISSIPFNQLSFTQKYQMPKQQYPIPQYPMQQINTNIPRVPNLYAPSLNFPTSPSLGLKTSVLQSPSIIKQAQSHISPIDSNFKLKGTGIADDIRNIYTKPSLLARESTISNHKQINKKVNFSKTGSIQGTNKIYNDNPVLCYQKLDFSDLNHIGNAWLYFQGNFKDGKRVGPGTLYLSNGEQFQGNFINDNPEGRGKYSTLDWKQIQGIWKNGQLMSIL